MLFLTCETAILSIVENDRKTEWDYTISAAIPPNGQQHEIIDGVRFVHPSPNLHQQEVSRPIQFQLDTQIELWDWVK